MLEKLLALMLVRNAISHLRHVHCWLRAQVLIEAHATLEFLHQICMLVETLELRCHQSANMDAIKFRVVKKILSPRRNPGLDSENGVGDDVSLLVTLCKMHSWHS